MTLDLKLGLSLGHWSQPRDDTETVQVAEQLGYESVWTTETYGSDALTPLTWYGSRTNKIGLGALLQVGARTPAAVAMAATTLDRLSQGRFSLGLGVSGPVVIEGWYGVDFSNPIERSEEYLLLVRQMVRRDAPVSSPGPHYPIPYQGGTSLGKPLFLNVRPLRTHIPTYVAATGPINVSMAGRIADGLMPMWYHPERSTTSYADVFSHLQPGFEISAFVPVQLTNDIEGALHNVQVAISIFLGDFGIQGMNFHLNAVSRIGYEEEAKRVQDLYLAGSRQEAAEAVPLELADSISLVGPIARIRERLEIWRESPVTTILATGIRDEPSLRALKMAVSG